MSKSLKAILLILLVLFIDQASKIYIKTNFTSNEVYSIFSWAKIHFVENPGMAFGLEFGGEYGKLALSIFRVVMVGFLGYFLRHLIKEGASFGLIACFSLIFAGAVGNILDSIFYGMVFGNADITHLPAEYLGFGNGYANKELMGGFLSGKVVDMFHFPFFNGHFPTWLPVFGGDKFQFFQYIFNIADTAIFLGVVGLLTFHRNFFTAEKEEIIPALER